MISEYFTCSSRRYQTLRLAARSSFAKASHSILLRIRRVRLGVPGQSLIPVKIVLVVEKLLAPSLRHVSETVLKDRKFQLVKKHFITQFIVIFLGTRDTHINIGRLAPCVSNLHEAVAKLEQCEPPPLRIYKAACRRFLA